jgi:hypothetical protein
MSNSQGDKTDVEASSAKSTTASPNGTNSAKKGSFRSSLFSFTKRTSETSEDTTKGNTKEDKKEGNDTLKEDADKAVSSNQESDRDEVPATAPFSSQPIVAKADDDSEERREKKKKEVGKSTETRNGDDGSDSSKDKTPARKLPTVPPVALKNRASKTSTAENSDAGSDDEETGEAKPAKYSASHQEQPKPKPTSKEDSVKKVETDENMQEYRSKGKKEKPAPDASTEEGSDASDKKEKKKPAAGNEKKRKREEKTRRNSDESAEEEEAIKKPVKPKLAPKKKSESSEEESSEEANKKKKAPAKAAPVKDKKQSKKKASKSEESGSEEDKPAKSKSAKKASAVAKPSKNDDSEEEDGSSNEHSDAPSPDRPYPSYEIDIVTTTPKRQKPSEERMKIKELELAHSYLTGATASLKKMLDTVFADSSAAPDDEPLSFTKADILKPVFGKLRQILYNKDLTKRKVSHKKIMNQLATLLNSYHTAEEVKATKNAEATYFKASTNFFASRFGFAVYLTPDGLTYVASSGVKKLLNNKTRKQRTKMVKEAVDPTKYPLEGVDPDNWTFMKEIVASVGIAGREFADQQTEAFERAGKSLPAPTSRSLTRAHNHLKKHNTFLGSEEAVLLAKNVMEAFNETMGGGSKASSKKEKEEDDMIVSDEEAEEDEEEAPKKKPKKKKSEESSDEDKKATKGKRPQKRKEDPPKGKKASKKDNSGSSESSSTAKATKPSKKKKKQHQSDDSN